MYHLYLLECKNGAIYTGISMDVARRIKQHRAGTGARYTKIFGVSKLLYTEPVGDVGAALKRELQVKRWLPKKKWALALTLSASRKGVAALTGIKKKR